MGTGFLHYFLLLELTLEISGHVIPTTVCFFWAPCSSMKLFICGLDSILQIVTAHIVNTGTLK